MKLRTRRKPRLSPFLLVSTFSATGLWLTSLETDAAAQSAGAKLTTLSLSKTNETLSVRSQNTPAPPANSVPKIGEIVVIGNKTLSTFYIISASGHHVGEPFTLETQEDMQAKLYATGFFGENTANPDVDAVKVTSEEPNRATGTCKVIIEVVENTTVTGIELTGTGPIKTDVVLPLLNIHKGVVFNPIQFRRDLVDIQDLYNKRGYEVTIGQDSNIDPETGVFHVSLVVTRVSDIKIVGAHKTRRYVILRQINTKVHDFFNTNTLEEDRRRLLNMDLFEEVNINPYPTGPGTNGITINLVEKKTGTVSAGVGYSQTSSLTGFAEVQETNFRGAGETLSLRGEIGGIAGKPSVDLGFIEPVIDKHRTSLNVQLYDKIVYRFSNSLDNGFLGSSTNGNHHYYEQRAGTTITVGRPFLKNFRGTLSLRAENVYVDKLSLPEQDLQITQNGPIGVLGSQIIHDTRDYIIDPVSGGYQILGLEVGAANLKPPGAVLGTAFPGVFGNVSFGKASIEDRHFINLGAPRTKNKPTAERPVLAVRGMIGLSTGTLPFFEQYFAGGADTIRGYRDDRFWGAYRYLASVEYRQPLAQKFTGVIFLDSGDAWGGAYSKVNLLGFTQAGFSPREGIGLGIRVVTPIGPLRLDYGFGSEGGRLHFSIGNTF